MKFIILICLAVLTILNCSKYKNVSNNFEDKNIFSHGFESQENPSENINDDNIIEQDIKMAPVFELTEEIKMNFMEYFPNGNFQVLEEPLDVSYRKILFAVHSIKNIPDYNNDNISICDTIVGFEIIDGSFQRYLLIKDFRFVSIDESILYDFSEKYLGIYGFNIVYSYPKVAGYTPGLVINTYFDNGNRVADSFSISWDEDNKKFSEELFW